MEKTINIVILC